MCQTRLSRCILSLILIALLAFPLLSSAQVSDADIDATIQSLMETHNVPGVSIAIIKNGKLHSTKTYGVKQVGSSDPITPESMFSVGSISKVGNAFLTLKLVSEGVFSLDEPVNTYLKSWKIPKGRYNRDQAVTLRHLLSHTAGTSVHGFADFNPDEDLPTTVQILNSTGPAKNPAVVLVDPVGTRFRYSGGGTTIMQMMIEDHFGKVYEEIAAEQLFTPLGLERSTYQNPLPASYGDIAKAHNRTGRAVAKPRGYEAMPEKAASGLWTTPSQLATLLSTLFPSLDGDEAALLPKELVEDMISPELNSEYGLGPRIRSIDDKTAIQHGGANNSYRAFFRIFRETRNGWILFTNATNGSQLINGVVKDMNAFVEQ